jgi:ribonuclease P protein component
MARPIPVRGHRCFEQLRVEGISVRTRLVSIRALRGASLASELRVSYAVGRHVGPAVARNRVRRRLRSLISERNLPNGQYLVAAHSGSIDATYRGLSRELDDALGRLEVRIAAKNSQVSP